MNSVYQTGIFTMALGLSEPWEVTSVEMVPSEQEAHRMEVHIAVDFCPRDQVHPSLLW